MKRLPGEECQLVSVLTWSWYSYGPLKYQKHYAEFEHQIFNCINLVKHLNRWSTKNGTKIETSIVKTNKTTFCTGMQTEVAQALIYGIFQTNCQLGLMSIRSLGTHRPVVIQVAQFVGQFLDVIWLQIGSVPDDIVMRWCHCSLVDTLWHKEKVVRLPFSYSIVNNSAGRGVGQTTSISRSKELGGNSFFDNYHCNHWPNKRE